MRTLVYRGTPLTSARDVSDLLEAGGQDLDLCKVRIGSDMLVNARIYNDLKQQWVRLAPYVLGVSEVRLVGHSLGGDHALATPAFIPRNIIPHVFAFAPFQCANAKFWGATYAARPTPRCYGRAEDFAPGWNHLDPTTVLAAPITHLLGGGKTEVLNSWSWMGESVEDHAVEKYAADLAAVQGEEEAAEMCRLSAAVYAEKTSDVVAALDAEAYRVLNVVEADGFRCAVCEER